MNKYEKYLEVKKEHEKSKKWQERDGRTDGNLNKPSFYISLDHCEIKLQRKGQEFTGSNNYWKSPDALNRKILEVIKSDRTIIERALELIKKDEDNALLECQSFVEKIQKDIEVVNKAKEDIEEVNQEDNV